jgi:hypothetical protein
MLLAHAEPPSDRARNGHAVPEAVVVSWRILVLTWREAVCASAHSEDRSGMFRIMATVGSRFPDHSRGAHAVAS